MGLNGKNNLLSIYRKIIKRKYIYIFISFQIALSKKIKFFLHIAFISHLGIGV